MKVVAVEWGWWVDVEVKTVGRIDVHHLERQDRHWTGPRLAECLGQCCDERKVIVEQWTLEWMEEGGKVERLDVGVVEVVVTPGGVPRWKARRP